MKRWWLVVLLLLSVGLNLGLLAQRARAEKKAALDAEIRAAEERAAAAATIAASRDPAEPPDPQPREPLPLEEQPHNPRHPREKPPFLVRLMERMANEVGVEGEQREKFLVIQQGFFERTFETRETLRRRQQALRQNMMSPQPDRALASRQVEELSQTQKELEQAFLDNFFETTVILDEGQRKRYRRLILELRKMRWDRGRQEDQLAPEGPPAGPPGEGPRQQRRRERREALEREREARDGEMRQRPPRPPGGG